MTASLLGYQYVVLRFVPRVDRDEFVNVGVVLYSQAGDFLDCAFAVNPDRLGAFAPDVDLAAVEAALRTIGAICCGKKAPGPSLDGLGQRFGWLAAPRSTVVQPGPVHGGLTSDPAVELERLLALLVG
jgi:hypothetical protein